MIHPCHYMDTGDPSDVQRLKHFVYEYNKVNKISNQVNQNWRCFYTFIIYLNISAREILFVGVLSWFKFSLRIDKAL